MKPDEVGKVVQSMEPKVLNRVDMPNRKLNVFKKDLDKFIMIQVVQLQNTLQVQNIKQGRQVPRKLCMAEIKRLVERQTVNVWKHIT